MDEAKRSFRLGTYPAQVCVATTTAAHLRSNVKALALDLDEADLAWLARGP